MAEERVIRLVVESNIDEANQDLKSLETNLKKVSAETTTTKKGIDDVASNGGAIAILDSLTGGLATRFKDAYEATKLFNFSLKGMKSALIATGIGALVVALGTIIAYWDEIVAFITKANEKLQNQIDLNKDNVNQLNFEIKLLDAKAKILDAEGKSTVEINKQKEKVLKLLLLENDQLITNLKTQLKRETSQAKELSFFQKLVQLRSNYKLIGEIDAEEKTRLDEINKSIQDATINAETLKLNLIEINKPDDKKKEEDKKKELSKKDTSVEDAEFANQEKINAIREKFRLQNEDAEDETEFEKLQRRYERDLLDLERLDASEQQKIELENYYRNLRLDQEIESMDYLEQLEIEEEDARLIRQEKELADEKKLADEKIKIEETVADAKSKIQEAYINNIGAGFNLLGSLAGKNKAVMAAALIGENAAGIAKQVINTKAANALAKASPLNIPTAGAYGTSQSLANNISLGLGIASSVAATAKGLSALGAGGNAGGGVGANNAQTSAPSFNLVQGTGSNQVAETINQNQRPIQAYVVGSNVTSQQELDRRRVSNSSI